MSGPFDDLTEAQRRQIREAHIAEKRRRAGEGFWTAGGWMRLEDAPPEPDEDIKPSHLWPCGCLKNDAGAHRAGCPDHPEGVRGD